jgi:hypothetical protein
MGPVHFDGGDLAAKLVKAPHQLTPDDFRLRPDSAGYHAGPNGKDLGADIDLVGPGAAYERWKTTAEYQQWLKDTGQKKSDEADSLSVLPATQRPFATIDHSKPFFPPLGSKANDFNGQAAAKKVELTPTNLANLTPLVDDDFRDSRKSVFHRWAIPLNAELFLEDGLYIGMMRPRPGIRTRHIYCDADKCFSADFACQATGRVLADNDEGWSIHLHTVKMDRFFSIRVNGKQEIEIADAPKDPAFHITRGPFPNSAIRPVNEFNTLLVILRDGQTLEIYANGQPVTAPLKFDPPLGSVVPALAFWQRNANDQATVRAEFNRFTVWLKHE